MGSGFASPTAKAMGHPTITIPSPSHDGNSRRLKPAARNAETENALALPRKCDVVLFLVVSLVGNEFVG